MMGERRGAWSLVLGMVAVVVLPVAILATRYSTSYDLLHAGLFIPVAVAAGIGAVVLSRRARALDRATLRGARGGKTATWGRILGILGLCLAASATISFAVYAVLIAAD